MIFFITVLRALAACLITNSHYTGVYPTDLIANGGLFGNVIFFAVSGFCLVNIKESFPKWYAKRLVRLLPATWLMTAIYGIVGLFRIELTFKGLFSSFIFPSRYYFISSILVLYIPFYFIMKYDKLKLHIPQISLAIASVWLIYYVFFYDKSRYHIDAVGEPMILFLFMFAMLIGAYCRIEKERFINKECIVCWIALPISLIAYFASKMLFVKFTAISKFQIINQLVLLLLLFVLFRCFASIDSKLENLPKPIKTVITFISTITLEIYLVQLPLIHKINFLPFPANWFFITAVIILLAFLLNKITNPIYSFFKKALDKHKK